MTQMVIVESEVGTSFFNTKEKIVTNVYHGRFKLEAASVHIKKLEAFYINNTVLASLTDLSKVYGSYAKLLAPFKSTYSKLAQSSLKYTAIVTPKDIILENLTLKVQALAAVNNIKIEIFKTRNDAERGVKEALSLN